MNFLSSISAVPAPRAQREAVRLTLDYQRLRSLASKAAFVAGVALLTVTHAMAQGTPSTAGIGAQTQNMAQEASTTGGFVGSTAMYIAALICFVGGVWALWTSRNPQDRSPGKIGMGVAGIALCGLFASGGVWINKASNTASGGNSTISSTSGAVTFGGGGTE